MKALLISVRGFHAGYLGCYGNEWISTPALDRLAASGVVFDQHFTDVPEAAAARRAWRSGRYQFSDSVGAGADTPDLVAELRRHDVRTVLVVDGSRPVPEPFSQGWDRVEVVKTLTGEASFLEQTLEAARAALRELKATERWLLWVDLATLLPPWEIPTEFSAPYFEAAEEKELPEDDDEDEEENFEEEEGEEFVEEEEEEEEIEEEEDEPLTPWFDPAPGIIDTEDDIDFARLQSSYAAAASFVDAAVDSLLEELERAGGTADCLVMLTADHGQALGEHGIVGPYRPWLHDELIHVPLLLRLPLALAGGREDVKGVRVSALTQSVDVMPTLLEAFGVPLPDGVQGRSLLPLAREEQVAVRAYAGCHLQTGGESEGCLRTPEWGLVRPGPGEQGSPRQVQLYVKPDDRWEVNDVIQHHLELADALEQTWKEFVAATAVPGSFLPPPLRITTDAPE